MVDDEEIVRWYECVKVGKHGRAFGRVVRAGER